MVSETEVVGAVCSNHTPCREAQVSCFGKNNTQCLHCSLFLRMIGQRRLVLPFLLPFCVKALSCDLLGNKILYTEVCNDKTFQFCTDYNYMYFFCFVLMLCGCQHMPKIK